MVGLGHCPMISKYGPSLSKAVGPVDPSFLVVKNLILIKKIILQRVYVFLKTESTCRLSIQLNISEAATEKKDKAKIFITNGSLMKVKGIAEYSTWSILQYF